MVNRISQKQGFTLVEVLVSTIVMTMMMVSVIAYVQYGGEIWRKGHNKISSENYKRMAFELIRQDLMRATSVVEPAVSTTGMTTDIHLGYTLLVGGVTRTCKIFIATASERVLNRFSDNGSLDMRIARNVANFSVNRISTWTLEILLEIQSDVPDEDGNYEIISQDKVTMMAPGAG